MDALTDRFRRGTRPSSGSHQRVGLGLATQALSPQDAVLGFAAALAATVAVVSRRLLGAPARA